MPLRKVHRDARHPFEWVMILFITVYAVLQFTTDTFPGAIDSTLSSGWKWGWGSLFTAGTITTLIGIWAKNDSRGLVLERVGLFWTGGACIAYSIAILDTGNSGGFFAVALFTSFAVSCWLRSWIIRRDMKAIAAGKYTK